MDSHVYVVTHGKKFAGANPGMTEEGFAEVSSLRSLLPADIWDVVCGTGRRHLDVAKALSLKPTRYTSAVGGPDSGECSTGKGAVDVVRLPDDTLVPYGIYTTLIDGADAAIKLAVSLNHNSVICAGRPSMVMYGVPEAESKSAAIYQLTVDSSTIVKIVEVTAKGIAEIHAV